MARTLEDELWAEVEDQCDRFVLATSHPSDLFALLACILALYQVRGTEPEVMIGPVMQERMRHFVEQAQKRVDR